LSQRQNAGRRVGHANARRSTRTPAVPHLRLGDLPGANEACGWEARPRGMFRVMNLPVTGVCTLLLLFARHPSSYVIQGESTQRVAVVMEVTDPCKAPIPGAQVELISVENATTKVLAMDPAGSAQAELERGEYDAIVTMQAFRPLSRRVSVNADQGQKLQFVLQIYACPPGCPVISEAPDKSKFVNATIVVVDQSGAAIPDAQIKITPDETVRAPKNPKTDERGELRLKLIPGTYSLFASEPLFSPAGKTIQVSPRPGQIFQVMLPVAETTRDLFVGRVPTAPAASASVAIIVTNSKGIPVPHAQIEARPSSWTLQLWEADERGKLSVKVFPSNYEFAVTSPAYQRWTKHIEIRDGENRTIRVLLAELGI
jgi:hypothetical protein